MLPTPWTFTTYGVNHKDVRTMGEVVVKSGRMRTGEGDLRQMRTSANFLKNCQIEQNLLEKCLIIDDILQITVLITA